ncbi:CheR family methyltransferase [Occallatibacter riparius]|uniref:protein-glutamate O-methyltransferase n=1 Tax=Occallatibacter riparius TaxID=1002689 RepID=A0A9J7BT51_9BACT|nr:protein-glutamate O-methyltransferase CheR [Occallatibacter riparius]UWZ84078.1 protein-glutamate O-methyltransferase CheR [Occallatibacter riparius]
MPATQVVTDFAFLRKLVQTHSQNVLDPSRDYVFQARLSRILRSRGMGSLAELVEYLRSKSDVALELAVADAMTINETSFFRDGRPFELLRLVLLPKLIDARRTTRALRIWSAACSTGQEAYSLAILIREHFPTLVNWNIRVEGTDICEDVVNRARSGRYQRIEVNRGLPARFLVRYFEQDGDEWVLKPQVRSLCNFQKVNLCKYPLPFRAKFDVIFLRNVMLYFAPETRLALLSEVHRLLAPDGVLFLGSTEQPVDPSLWTATLSGGTCHFRPRTPS